LIVLGANIPTPITAMPEVIRETDRIASGHPLRICSKPRNNAFTRYLTHRFPNHDSGVSAGSITDKPDSNVARGEPREPDGQPRDEQTVRDIETNDFMVVAEKTNAQPRENAMINQIVPQEDATVTVIVVRRAVSFRREGPTAGVLQEICASSVQIRRHYRTRRHENAFPPSVHLRTST
jgi:hypothetical protein